MKMFLAIIFLIIPALSYDSDIFFFSPEKLDEACKQTEKFNLLNEKTAPLNPESKDIIASCINDIFNCQIREETKHCETAFIVQYGYKIIATLSFALIVSITVSVRQYLVIKILKNKM